ncbi:polyketide synthase [Westerdykella ornata]|uniref:Polyketide synthase n=1 Tax=Westerdykella ornata TaxID=318751 RepID=A0A6A6JLD0_WESOR|nr:polyketide synthase [Westerdykella ornata]KAF2275719.1 polyketide synthase [Westerdykella ornata]
MPAKTYDAHIEASPRGVDSVDESWGTSCQSPDPIAVVGMGCRLPGGVSNPSELWELLINKRTGRRNFTRSRLNLPGFYHPDHQRPGSINTEGGYLLDEDPRLFDHAFFGMNTSEVMTMDPQQRKILEVAYEALESAGEPWEKFSGSNTGVYVGNFNIDHHVMQMHDIDFPLPYAPTGGSSSILANRVNYLLNLRGPSMTVDTACSSSMYALHLAVNAIRNGECDAAIVGGSNLISAPEMQLLTVKLGALSPTSTCHTFDELADGYARAEGFTALYLKRYSDAVKGDYPIRAVIRATGVNSNGRTAGISHPSVEGQENLIRQVYRTAGLPTHLTGYFECHGTGTPVGDPVEVTAIGRVFAHERLEEPLLVGSVKTNLGHSEPASGLVGLMKAILAIEHGTIPPTVGVQKLNPNIDFNATRVRVVTEATPWPQGLLRRASVNSFGYGGANGHCIVDHPSILDPTALPYTHSINAVNGTSQPYINGTVNGLASHSNEGRTNGSRMQDGPIVKSVARTTAESTRRLVLLPFSAHDPDSLSRNIAMLAEALPKLPLADVAYTLSARRSRFRHKSFAIVDRNSPEVALTMPDVTSLISANEQSPRIGFVFTGQGAQHQEMGRALFDYGIFRESIRQQDAVLQLLSFSPPWRITDVLNGECEISVHEPEISQTVCTALQIGLVDLLRSWNVRPDVTIGHSSGEMAAAYASGRLSLAEAIVTAYCRGHAIAQNARQGAMLAVGIGADTVQRYLNGVEHQVKIAAINSPSSVTLSGDVEPIHELERRFKTDEIFCRILQTGGNAYHSHHMNAIGNYYEDILTKAYGELHLYQQDAECFQRQHPVPWVSSVTPNKAMVQQIPLAYWRRNLESPVQFYEAVQNLVVQPHTAVDILVEVGPHSALQSPLKEILTKVGKENGIKPPLYLTALKRFDDGMRNILTLCGSLFCLNANVDLAAVNSNEVTEDHPIRYVHGKVCVDMPTYRFKYGEPLYYENRIAKEIRLRKHLRHDLLGVRQAGCAKESPSWRNVLRQKDLPWLKDHKLLPHAVMPGSGYVCMAIEAISQFLDTDSKSTTGAHYQLRNVSIKSAMRIPEDEIGLEVITTLQQSSISPAWFDFRISSYSPTDETWTDNASGLVKMDASLQADVALGDLSKDMDPRVIEMEDWQEKFQQIGLGYGKAFQGLSNLRADPIKKLATANVALQTTDGMLRGLESGYPIHPASLDLCHQLALIATHGGQAGSLKNAFIPVYIDEMSVWARDEIGSFGHGTATGEFKGLRGAQAKVQLLTPSSKPIVEIYNLRCVSYNGGDASTSKPGDQPAPYTRLVWKPDIALLTNEDARKLFPPTMALDDLEDTFATMDKIAACMIVDIAERFCNIDSPESHLRRFLAWVKRSVTRQHPVIHEAQRMSHEYRLAIIERLCTALGDVPDVKHTKRIYDNISEILYGTKTGIEVATQDGLLQEMYARGMGIQAGYSQLKRLLDLLGHKTPHMKILEIGAGTGGATRIALRTLGGDTAHKQYSEYHFTDVSPAFLGAAEAEFGNCKGMAYKTLDISKSPCDQGFAADYDLIIASQCLHTTQNISQTLTNARSLLKEGGKMVFLESTRTWLGHSLAYGTFPDWWPEDSEKDSPFLTREDWKVLLLNSGFSGVDIELDDYPRPLTTVSTIVTTALSTTTCVSAEIVDQGRTAYIVRKRESPDLGNLVAELQRHGYEARFQDLNTADIPDGAHVIVATDLGNAILVDGCEDDFYSVKKIIERASCLVWLTKGGIVDGSDPKPAVATGLIRMLITENQLNNYGICHLDPEGGCTSPNVSRNIVRHFLRVADGNAEREVAMYNTVPHASRLLIDDSLNERYNILHGAAQKFEQMVLQNGKPMMVDFETPGLLSSLYFREDVSFRKPLPEDYIEVQTAAVGLNWKDIAVSAGRLDMNACSSECAGTITAVGSAVKGLYPGDRVYGLAWGRFGTRPRFPSAHAQAIPQRYSFEEAATVPIVFCTAVYALKHLARVRKGESVLIQSATGGLGLASIQVAQSMGAEIYATVGTLEKKEYLIRSCGISPERIFSSRDSNDISRLLASTNGKGFNVILSTSNGDLMHETWRCIAPRGRFIDVGRVDVQNHGTIALEVFERNATFSSFDLSTMAVQDPEFCAELIQEVGDMLRSGQVQPIPFKTFDINELDKGMLYFSQGKHIGKVVASYRNQEAVVKMIPPKPEAYFDPSAEYVLVGGLGGLGRSILQWMVSRGALHFTIMSRSGDARLSKEASEMIETLRSQGITVELVACDINVKESVSSAIAAASLHRPIKGILHAAVAFLDQPFDTLPYAQWKGGLSAKVQGTINLHEVTIEQKLPLDFFIMTSSFEAVVALPTQAAYCAANSFQDAFARYRRLQGLPATAIAFGLITEIGDVGQRDATRQMIQRNGLYRTGELGFLRLLEAAFLDSPESKPDWHAYDPLAEAQITTCLEPSQLAKIAHQVGEGPPPRWHSDAKFSHLFRAMQDCLSTSQNSQQVKSVVSAVATAVDAAIQSGNIGQAGSLIANAIAERTASLLMIPSESIGTQKSVAQYGVDSLIAVELRSWVALMFGVSIPLLKLLDEKISIRELGGWIAKERESKL